jgi:hypothetical protein
MMISLCLPEIHLPVDATINEIIKISDEDPTLGITNSDILKFAPSLSKVFQLLPSSLTIGRFQLLIGCCRRVKDMSA